MLSVRSLSGPGTLKGYATRLGAEAKKPVSLRRLAGADVLHRRWEQYGGVKVLGSPVGDVETVGGSLSRRYSAGRLRLTAGLAQLEEQKAYRATVSVAGVYCVARAKTDQIGGPSSEPYLIATVVDESMKEGDAKAILVGGKAASDIDGGDWIGYGETIWEGANPGQLNIQLAMWEEDGGQSAEIRGKVETTINDGLKVASLYFPAIGIVRNMLGPVADRAIRSMANLIKEAFKDDAIGQAAVTLNYFDFVDNLPPTQVFEGAKYRTIVPINGGKAGDYRVYLNWTVTGIPVPEP